MFCQHCGEELATTARFCPGCGAASASATGPAPIRPEARREAAGPETDPVVVLRPRFVPKVTLLQTLPISLFMMVWGAGFFGGFSLFAIQALGLPVPQWAPFVLFGALFGLGLPVLVYSVARRSTERTEYRVFSDRVEYFEGFFNVEEKAIALEDVTEVQLTKGVLQRSHGLGTVALATRASAGAGRRPGVRLVNIEDPDHVYGRLKELVDRARRGGGLRRAA